MKNSPLVQLGSSDLNVTPICLGTMIFGAQVDEATSFNIMDRALERGINFFDTAEMYAVPPRPETYNHTEIIIGNWFAKRPDVRKKLVLATKVAGPARGMNWIRNGDADLTEQMMVDACDASLKRLKTDVIDLYQIHWPSRHVPAFGILSYDPSKDLEVTPILGQLRAMDKLVKAGKIRAFGISNETPFGVHEFERLAEAHGLAKVATVQNPYCLLNRTLENGLDETMHRLGVSQIPYSPLAFGLLTGKFDKSGLSGEGAPADARLTMFETMRKQRWGRPEALIAARRYNALAQTNGMTPTQMALAFCYTKWQIASTIIGVRTVAQLDECIDAYGTVLSKEVLAEIDKIRWEIRDPAQ